MRNLRIIISLTIILLPYFPYAQEAADASPIVWLEDGMTRILKTDPARSNSTLNLYSAKNEYEPFQIVVKAPASNDLTNVNVTITELVGPNGYVIRTNNIDLYREHYLFVTQGSKVHNPTTNSPLGSGWYPDALIPFRDPETGNDLTGRFDGVPFNVTAGENQPVWADIYVPPDSKAGIYSGYVEITSDQGSGRLNVILNVWNFWLPQKRSLHSYANFMNRPTRITAIELLEHRFNPKTVDPADERFLIDHYGLDFIDVFRGSKADNNNCAASPAPSPEEVRQEISLHQPDLYLSTSYANEVWPCTNLIGLFFDWARNLRAGGSHPMIVTYPTDELMGSRLNNTAGDIWAILPKHYDQAKTNIERLIANPTTEVWFYNPLVQDGYSPKFTIDFLLINYRIFHGFIGQSLGAKGIKFWRVDNWTSDPWTNAEASRPDAPGEGHMVYPGGDVGLPGRIVSGIRMKLLREGSEDYEYIEILKNLGQEQFALAIARNVGSDFHRWTKDKDVLLSARRALGEKIHEINSMAPSPGLELIRNPGFEFDIDRDGSPDGWYGSGKNKFTNSAIIIHNGSYSGRHFSSADATYSIGQTVSNITGNASYRFSAWTNIPVTKDAFTYTIQLSWKNASGRVIRTDTIQTYNQTYNMGASGWNWVYATKISPTSARTVDVRMVLISLTGTIYVDDFSLIKL